MTNKLPDEITAMPRVGQKWALKSRPERIAIIKSVCIDSTKQILGYVELERGWCNTYHGCALDTFFKYYRRANNAA